MYNVTKSIAEFTSKLSSQPETEVTNMLRAFQDVLEQDIEMRKREIETLMAQMTKGANPQEQAKALLSKVTFNALEDLQKAQTMMEKGMEWWQLAHYAETHQTERVGQFCQWLEKEVNDTINRGTYSLGKSSSTVQNILNAEERNAEFKFLHLLARASHNAMSK